MAPSRRPKKKAAAASAAASTSAAAAASTSGVPTAVTASVVDEPLLQDDHGPPGEFLLAAAEEQDKAAAAAAAAAADDKCPACTTTTDAQTGDIPDKETWIQCDACKTWFHWNCAGNGGDAEQVDKWFCEPCTTADPSRVITLKPTPTRKSARRGSAKAFQGPTDAGGDTPMLDATSSTTPAAAAAPSSVPPSSTTSLTTTTANTLPLPHSTLTPTTSTTPMPTVAVAVTTTTTTTTADLNKWIAVAHTKPLQPDTFRRMQGSDIGMEWILGDPRAMTEPIVVEVPEGLGMKMPPREYTVRDVAADVGPDTPLEVIDVASQSTSPHWTLGKWAEYYHSPASDRDKIRNVISLEVSGTPLGAKILPPRLVREIDWVEKFWPPAKKVVGLYPKVQLYCLMSVAQSWTDWHIDFAGSSVYYHILRGSKVFYFIRPTAANLAAYEHWSGTSIQNSTWLGDMCDEVIKVQLTEGNTMIIPTGWIHAVYTPCDTLVFGGNFLHSMNMSLQLRVREIEIRTRVPKKFRFPFFTRLCWYAGEKYLKDLKAKEDFSPRVLRSIDALARFLVAEVRTMERGTEAAKREAKEPVPVDKIKDPASVARELRWRARAAAGVDSGDELEEDDDNSGGVVKREGSTPGVGGSGSGSGSQSQSQSQSQPPPNSAAGRKRRRPLHDGDTAKPLFRNWQPPEWGKVEVVPMRETQEGVVLPLDGDAAAAAATVATATEGGGDTEPEHAEGWMRREGLVGNVWRTTRVNEVTKVRRLGNGAIERYRIVRTVEYVVPERKE